MIPGMSEAAAQPSGGAGPRVIKQEQFDWF